MMNDWDNGKRILAGVVATEKKEETALITDACNVEGNHWKGSYTGSNDGGFKLPADSNTKTPPSTKNTTIKKGLNAFAASFKPPPSNSNQRITCQQDDTGIESKKKAAVLLNPLASSFLPKSKCDPPTCQGAIGIKTMNDVSNKDTRTVNSTLTKKQRVNNNMLFPRNDQRREHHSKQDGESNSIISMPNRHNEINVGGGSKTSNESEDHHKETLSRDASSRDAESHARVLNIPDEQPYRNNTMHRNKKICTLGKRGEWKEILLLQEAEKKYFDNVNYATAMTQLKKIRTLRHDDTLFINFIDDLACQLRKKGLQWMEIRGVANIVHAIAKMNLKSESSKLIVELVVSRKEDTTLLVKEGNPQDIANTSWACAKLGVKAPNLFNEVDQRAEWLVNEGSPQAIANTAWAYATLGITSLKLFNEIERQAEWLVNEGNIQDVANTAWAFATVGIEAPNLFNEIDQHAEWLVNEGKPKAVTITAWAFATFGKIKQRAKWLVKEGSPQAIANTAWAYATLGIESPMLFENHQCYSMRLSDKPNG